MQANRPLPSPTAHCGRVALAAGSALLLAGTAAASLTATENQLWHLDTPLIDGVAVADDRCRAAGFVRLDGQDQPPPDRDVKSPAPYNPAMPDSKAQRVGCGSDRRRVAPWWRSAGTTSSSSRASRALTMSENLLPPVAVLPPSRERGPTSGLVEQQALLQRSKRT